MLMIKRKVNKNNKLFFTYLLQCFKSKSDKNLLKLIENCIVIYALKLTHK